MNKRESIEYRSISQSFKRVLPSQCIIVLTGLLPSLISSFLAGNLLDPIALAAMSYADPIKYILASINGVISIGFTIILGKYVGSGDTKGANSIYTVGVCFSLIFGFITMICLNLWANPIAGLLSVENEAVNEFVNYLYGWSIITIPMLLVAALMVVLQVYSQQSCIYLFVPLFIVIKVSFGYLFVQEMGMGSFGIGLSSSLAMLTCAIMMLVWLKLTCKNIRFKITLFSLRDFWKMIFYGTPFIVGYLCLAIKDAIRNVVVAELGNMSAVAAISVTTSAATIFEAIPQGIAGTAVIISSIYIGSKNKDKLYSFMRYICCVSPIICAFTVVCWLCSCYALCSVFTDDAEVLQISLRFALFYAAYLLIYWFPETLIAVYQCIGRTMFSNILYIFYCLVLQVVSIYLLIPIFGLNAVWLSYVSNAILSTIMILVICGIKKRGFPSSIPDLLWLGKDFCTGKRYSCYAKNISESVNCSKKILHFLLDMKIDKKQANLISFACEEIGVDAFLNNCTKKHLPSCVVEYTVICNSDCVKLQITDNSDKFSSKVYEEVMQSEDISFHFGLRNTIKMSEEINYQNAVSLNTFSLTYNV